jgi:hypothetical protein
MGAAWASNVTDVPIDNLMSSKKKNKTTSYLSYRRNLVIELKKKYPRYTLISNFLGLLFFISLCLIIWEISIFRRTIIPVYIPLAIWTVTGITLTPFFKRMVNIYILNPYSPGYLPIFWHLFYNIVTWGGLSVFIFMWTNEHFTNNTLQDITTSINAYRHLATDRRGCGEPYVDISYKEQNKELFFPCGTPVEKYRLVHIGIEKGLFGFDVIKNQTLKEGN